MLSGAGEGENRELWLNSYRVSVWGNEKLLEIDGSDSSTTS